jgi:hypothetical protein
MAVGITMEFPGGTLEQYDEVMRRMALTGERPPPEGALFHWSAATADGIRVTDVWETPEQFERFAGTNIGPHTQAVGVPGPPRTEMVPAHSYFTAGEGADGAEQPVAVIVEFDGASLDQYDAAIASSGMTSGGPGAPGCLFHWSAATDGGFRVIDVWRDQATFEAFAASTIIPAVAAAGLSTTPRIEYVPVHNYLTT